MESKVPLFCQAEENSDLSDEGCNSLATNLPSRHIDNKKDIKFSQMTQKTISHEIRGLRLEHKKRKREMLSSLCKTSYNEVPQ
ncbi:low quality protein: ef-hand, partial [Lynx pardinus]